MELPRLERAAISPWAKAEARRIAALELCVELSSVRVCLSPRRLFAPKTQRVEKTCITCLGQKTPLRRLPPAALVALSDIAIVIVIAALDLALIPWPGLYGTDLFCRRQA